MRYRILLMGAPGSGKSQAIIDLARYNPDSKVVAFDYQDGIRPLLADLGDEVPNLDPHLIHGEPLEAWPQFKVECKQARVDYGEGDWICFDGSGLWWDLVKGWQVQRKYGVDLADFLADKAAAAQAAKPGKKALGFGGLETEDWEVIRAQYYTTIPQTLGAGCQANVLVTALAKDVGSWQKDGETVYLEPSLPPMYKRLGIKPEGEKGLTSQVDYVLQVEHPSEAKWKLRGLGKRGSRAEFAWKDITAQSVVDVFKEVMDG